MNDFTKKELEAIKRTLITHDFRYPDLMNKIQSMIDNYYEHEWHTNPYDFILYCQKCGKTTKSDEQRTMDNIK